MSFKKKVTANKSLFDQKKTKLNFELQNKKELSNLVNPEKLANFFFIFQNF